MLDDLLDAGDGDVHPRQRRLSVGRCPSFSVIESWPVSATRKFAPVMPTSGIDVQSPHVAAGDHRQFLGAVGRRRAEVLAEEIADLVAADVHAGKTK